MVPSPDCPHCPGVTETINHYLLSCPAHRQHREKAILAIGNRDWNTNNLLKGKPNPADPITNMTIIRELQQFILNTKRFSKK